MSGEDQTPLLPSPATADPRPAPKRDWRPFAIGSLAALLVLALSGLALSSQRGNRDGRPHASKHWPSRIGFAGPTPTGAEAFAVATGYPSNEDSYPLKPQSRSLLYSLGNLSPWRSVSHSPDLASAALPPHCTLLQSHLLHRHGARYPTSDSGLTNFVARLDKARQSGTFAAHGALEFLTNWQYKLGAEILTPFGREQLFNLGVAHRVKYGQLLNPDKKPVFRTESQDRMLKSALNFAAGFFGIPYEEQYHQLITVEARGFNNTLAPYMTCTNANLGRLSLTGPKTAKWRSVYLAAAVVRLAPLLTGLDLTVESLYNMQEMCAYELVSLGASVFCPLFTDEEWRGFSYHSALQFYYSFSFGQPAQAAMGLGWVQEWISRVEGKRITAFNSTTNSTLHDERFFPLEGQSIYVDATHDTIISAILTTLNFASFATSGPLPSTHIPSNLSFNTEHISPFAANLQAQIVSCSSTTTPAQVQEDKYVRWILNDGVVPLGNIGGCGENKYGLCELRTYLDQTKRRSEGIDWAYDCLADYELGPDEIRDGRPASRPNRAETSN